MLTSCLLAVILLGVNVSLISAASADVFNMPEGYTSLEWVTVGNPGNIGEWSGGYPEQNYRICGAVAYIYNIGKYEVTAGQYTEFLNAVAATDAYGLYNPLMDSREEGCQITQNGTSGNFTYDFSGRPSGDESDWVNRPVNYVSWGDSVRFANWLHNGQPTGPQRDSTTEDGSYYLDGVTSDEELLSVTRKPGATWVIPTEDEWYKAAYHKNDGRTGNYWDYPTRSDSGHWPNNEIVDPDPGNSANYERWDASPYWRTEVGEFENSGSPYGTFDQGGNVAEFNESIIASPWQSRIRRGGQFSGIELEMQADWRDHNTGEGSGWGFRVSQAPGLRGDLDGNGFVGQGDLGHVLEWWGQTVTAGDPLMGDPSGDGLVSQDDLDVVLADWGQGTPPVPEPATLSLLALGGLAAMRRKRKKPITGR